MTIVLSKEQQKLAKLVEIEGYDSADELMEAVFSDAVSPAISMNEGCDYTCEMEPDQDAGKGRPDGDSAPSDSQSPLRQVLPAKQRPANTSAA